LIALGTGGIKPCVSAFGGDQFKLPEQEKQLKVIKSSKYFDDGPIINDVTQIV
jgi:solute carrier family 15 oligopeptide transporter 1